METPTAIYFYGASDTMFGYMSNFYKCNFVEVTNTVPITYNSSEQYFMYRKCLLFDPNNTQLLKQILDETNPRIIKKYGRMVKNFKEDIWNVEKYNIMRRGLVLKFGQNKMLCDKLVVTYPKQLYEASPIDKVWGIGMGINSVITTPIENYGQNLLGKALMSVRDEFMK